MKSYPTKAFNNNVSEKKDMLGKGANLATCRSRVES